jgi:hypothetical protein
VGQAKDLALEQLPDIAYQYIAFERAYLTFTIVTAIVVFIGWQIFIIPFLNKQCLKNSYSKGRWDEDQGLPYVISTAGLGLFCGLALFNNIKDFFMVWFAPKIFIIENIIHLVKG